MGDAKVADPYKASASTKKDARNIQEVLMGLPNLGAGEFETLLRNLQAPCAEEIGMAPTPYLDEAGGAALLIRGRGRVPVCDGGVGMAARYRQRGWAQ